MLRQLGGGCSHRICVLHLEFDAHLGHGSVGWPLVGTEARLRRLGERPDAEMLAATNSLAVEVLTTRVGLERKSQGSDVQLTTLRRVCGDHGDAGDPFDVHGGSLNRPPSWSPARLPARGRRLRRDRRDVHDELARQGPRADVRTGRQHARVVFIEDVPATQFYVTETYVHAL